MTMHMQNMIDDFLRKLPKQRSTVAAHVKADLLLVNCIDCRYPHAIHNFMHETYCGKVYDHLVLAGAALASTEIHTRNPAWSQTFLQHVGLSIDLHEIDGVLILDHRTCGAYVKCGLLTEADHNKPREFAQHQMVAKDAAPLIGDVFKQKSRQGLISIYLTPEIPVGSSGFPTAPELLHEIQV